MPYSLAIKLKTNSEMQLDIQNLSANQILMTEENQQWMSNHMKTELNEAVDLE